MENFYELLDLRPGADRASIEAELKKLNKVYRNRVNLKDAKIRNEATDRINLIAHAMVKFRSDEDRVAYDRELEEHKNQRQLQEPLIDVDFYAFLGLPTSSPDDVIHRKLDELESKLATAPNNDDATLRERQVIRDARDTLLSPERRKKYNEQIASKQAFEKQRAQEQPIPIIIAGVEISDWVSLEKALDQHCDEGLFLLKDGEIEAWLRWSLGQKQRANWTREIATNSLKSDTPFLEFEQFQRLINPNRPLILYERGGRPGVGNPVIVQQIGDIPKLADKHWGLFRQHLEYILDWITEVTDHEALKSYFSITESGNNDIQLERLLYAIDPRLPPAEVAVEGVKDQTIDFGILSKWEHAEREIIITQSGRGYLYGSVKASANWLNVDTTHFEGIKNKLHIEVIPAKLIAEQDNQCQITINLIDNRIPPITVNVIVRQRTAWQSVTNTFKRKSKTSDIHNTFGIDDTQPHVLAQPKSYLRIIVIVLLLFMLGIGAVFAVLNQNGSISFPSATPTIIVGWERFESSGVAIQMPQNYGYFSFEQNLDSVLNQMSSMGPQFKQIAEAARQNPSLFVLWLYDKNTYGSASMTSVLVTKEPLQQSATIDMYLDAIETTYNAMQFKVQSRSIVSVGRYNAGRTIVKMTVMGNIQATTLSYIILGKDSVWSVTYGGNSNDFDGSLPIFEQSIRTLELP